MDEYKLVFVAYNQGNRKGLGVSERRGKINELELFLKQCFVIFEFSRVPRCGILNSIVDGRLLRWFLHFGSMNIGLTVASLYFGVLHLTEDPRSHVSYD